MSVPVYPTESKPFTCVVDDGSPDGVKAEGLVISELNTFDVQVFMRDKFYTFCIAQQHPKQYMMRMVKVHDRTGTLVTIKTLLISDTKVEFLFERVLQALLLEDK